MSLHAVMTLNLCLEGYGAVVHLMDSLFGTGVYAHSHRLTKTASSSAISAPDVPPGVVVNDSVFAARVRRAVGILEHGQAHAIWLIDVCGCSYAQAAVEMGISRDQLAATVASARHQLRSSVGEPLAEVMG